MTVKQFFQSLGGAAEVARHIGVPYTTVATWQQRGSIPSWRLAKVAELAIARGVSMPGSFAKEAA